MLRLGLAVLSIGLLACGDDGGTTPPQVDAPPNNTATVEAVTCPATADAAITTTGSAFDPASTTISVGQVVQFTMPSTHNVVPNSAGGTTDPNLTVNFSETKCLKFTAAGTYHFKCQPHGFTGSITVQ